MHLIVTNQLTLRQRNCKVLLVDFADCGGGRREDLHRLTLYMFYLLQPAWGAGAQGPRAVRISAYFALLAAISR
ncbi:hypothetical protein NUKP49_47750 [Klebsiella variicola]|nr:hypothetical protein NUKP49_47750 [Klebsiella variicola]